MVSDGKIKEECSQKERTPKRVQQSQLVKERRTSVSGPMSTTCQSGFEHWFRYYYWTPVYLNSSNRYLRVQTHSVLTFSKLFSSVDPLSYQSSLFLRERDLLRDFSLTSLRGTCLTPLVPTIESPVEEPYTFLPPVGLDPSDRGL